MWTLLRGINLAPIRRRLARSVVVAAVVIGTGTQVAMALLPGSGSRAPESGYSTAIESPNAQTAIDATVRTAGTAA